MSGLRSRGGTMPSVAIRELARDVQARKADALDAAGDLAVSTLVDVLSTPGRGRLRQQGLKTAGSATKPRKVKGVLTGRRTSIAGATRASAPGDPPAPDSGALRSSAAKERVGDTGMRVGVRMKYGAYLEHGTSCRGPRRGRGKLGARAGPGAIAPRPFLARTVERLRTLLGPAVRAVFDRAVFARGGVGGRR
ncbi:MAG TPA: hypothetical protein VFN76_09990 [Candidatus Limnocylindria bacterium]|nr:hypothetical protein [Candidatus Limnocylindria bacterium]